MTGDFVRTRLGWIAVAIVVVLVAGPGLRAALSQTALYDGGITASAGTFILHGAVPYRDFWLLYGPLAGYVAAVWTAIFGNELVVLRVVSLLLVVATALVGYGLIGDRVPAVPRVALAAIAALIPVYHIGPDLAPWGLAMALALGAILAITRPGHRWLFAAGILVGLAGLARPDVGAYALIAVTIATRSWRPAVGAALVVAPVAVLFALAVPLGSLVEQLVWYPIVGPRTYRGLPPPGILAFVEPGHAVDWLLYWSPLVLIGLAILRRLRTGAMPPTDLALLILAVLCRLQTLGRADTAHDAQAAVPAILLAAYALSGVGSRAGRYAIALGAAVFIALAALPLVWLVQPSDPYDRALRSAVAEVRARTGPDEPIFAGEVRNRHAFLNPLLAYYLADRPPGVRDTMYNPGVTTTDPTQQRMVDDLQRNRVRYLILDARYADCYETSNLSREPGSDRLDRALGQDYRVVADYGAVVIMALPDEPFVIVAPGDRADPSAPPDHDTFTCQRSAQEP